MCTATIATTCGEDSRHVSRFGEHIYTLNRYLALSIPAIMPTDTRPRYGLVMPAEWTSWTGATLLFADFAREVVVPGIASLWTWAKLFNIRTNELNLRVMELEQEVVLLRNAIADIRSTGNTERLPPYEP